MSTAKCPHPSSMFSETEYYSVINTDTELDDGYFGHVICNGGNSDLTITMGGVGESQLIGNPVVRIINISSGTGVVTVSGATEAITIQPGSSVSVIGHSDQWIPLKYQAVKTLYNNADSSLSATNVKGAIDELDAEKATYYLHTQDVAAATWTVNHNLGKMNCSVTIKDSSHRKVEGQIDYVTENQLTIAFTAAFSGTAYIV